MWVRSNLVPKRTLAADGTRLDFDSDHRHVKLMRFKLIISTACINYSRFSIFDTTMMKTMLVLGRGMATAASRRSGIFMLLVRRRPVSSMSLHIVMMSEANCCRLID
jgi:hypothetical protein